jgi:hypothetical protein
MTADTRRFRNSEELANAVFGSAVPTVEQRKLREEQHARAQVPPSLPPEPRREGWTPPGYRTDAIAELAFRSGVEMPEGVPYDELGARGQVIRNAVGGAQRKRIEAGIAKTMAEVVSHARGLKGG